MIRLLVYHVIHTCDQLWLGYHAHVLPKLRVSHTCNYPKYVYTYDIKYRSIHADADMGV